MILLDLFSGYGGFHLGLQQAGFTFDKVYYSEINKHALANYEYNFPNAQSIGDVRTVIGTGIERPDIITFGSPCQGFSSIGERKGLSDKRSVLIEYALSAVAYYRPTVFIWENVKGMFSRSHRKDFFAIYKKMSSIYGYRRELQLIDTAWLLPQHRERYYVVGYFADRCKGQVLPICENDSIFATQNKAKKRQTQTEDCCTTIRVGFGTKSDDTFILCNPDKNNNVRTLTGGGKGNRTGITEKGTYLKQGERLRRFTEIECERLQGLPDDWTKYGIYRGQIKEIAMKNRYDMIGNGVSTPVVEEIGKSILQNIEI